MVSALVASSCKGELENLCFPIDIRSMLVLLHTANKTSELCEPLHGLSSEAAETACTVCTFPEPQ